MPRLAQISTVRRTCIACINALDLNSCCQKLAQTTHSLLLGAVRSCCAIKRLVGFPPRFQVYTSSKLSARTMGDMPPSMLGRRLTS